MKAVEPKDFYSDKYTSKANPIMIRAHENGWIVVRKVGAGPRDVICRAHTGHGGVRIFRTLDTVVAELMAYGITAGSWRAV